MATVEIPLKKSEEISKQPSLTVDELIELLSKIEDKSIPVTLCVDGFTFVPIRIDDVDVISASSGIGHENDEWKILCVNANTIGGILNTKISDQDDYNVLNEISFMVNSLDSLGIMINDQVPETDKHVVSNLESLSLFTKHKSRSLHHISLAIKHSILMGDVVVADEDMYYIPTESEQRKEGVGNVKESQIASEPIEEEGQLKE